VHQTEHDKMEVSILNLYIFMTLLMFFKSYYWEHYFSNKINWLNALENIWMNSITFFKVFLKKKVKLFLYQCFLNMIIDIISKLKLFML